MLSLLDSTPPSEIQEEFYQARRSLSDDELPAGMSAWLVLWSTMSSRIPSLFALKRKSRGDYWCAMPSHYASAYCMSGIGAGLNEGDTVVVSGLFLIDSEANITGALERMRHPETMPDMTAQPANAHSGH
jgi:hypothetical protein